MTTVAVIGKGRGCPQPLRDTAYIAGGTLASLGVTVLTGGLGGVMDGAAQGCTVAGGTCIGLLPDEGEPSVWLTHAIRTGLSPVVRNTVLIAAADAVVALPGSHGTVQELALAEDRGIPIWRVGHHAGWLTGALGDTFGVAVKLPELPQVVGEWVNNHHG